MRILTGIQPSGKLHWGNYFGAMKSMFDLQEKGENFMFIANFHAMTTVRDGAQLREATKEVALDYLACGLDPQKTVMYRQSDVPEVQELAWYLSCLTPMGLLERCHSYKDKMAHGFEATHGLFAYPVLMAADILIMQSDLVPVGKDQKQHLEVTRDLCQKFNNAYGDIFKMPDAYIPETVATIPGTDGQKMSKSYHNTIELFDVSAKKKIMGIVTDSQPMEAKKEPDGNSIYELYKLFATKEEVEAMAAAFRAGGYGYGTAKKALLEAYHRLFDPFKARRDELVKDPDALEDILQDGAKKARAAAAPTMEKIRRAVGLKKFFALSFLLFASFLSPGAGDPIADGRVFGYQLDISRCKVPTMPTLYRIVDILASLGYNQFQLYTEHTFAYSQHETVWRGASPMTPDEVRALDAYCAARGIELVPNQNSFGHLERWLCHPEYNGLAELPAGGAVYRRWGDYVAKSPCSLCPTDPRSVPFLAGLYDELFPCFRSRYVNVGCDETIELEDAECKGRSAAAIREKGASRVYLDFLLKIHELCAERKHVMMFWGDIILHKPELISELPADAVCLNWGYGANHPFARETAVFRRAKRRFIVCPGTSAWGSLSGRTANMMANIDNAVTNGLANGMSGLMVADWGDGGHPNPWIVSVPAIVYAAHRMRGETLSRAQLAAEINRALGCQCGEALLAYGDIYAKAKGRMGNTTELFHLLEQGNEYKRAAGVTDATLAAALEQWRYAENLFDPSGAPEWVKDDFLTLDLLYRAVEMRIKTPDKANFRACFEPEYRRLWLRQNRVGGLDLSLVSVFGR